MPESPIYLPEVRCDVSPGGILPDGVTARIRGSDGQSQSIQVTREMINPIGGVDYLTVGLIQIDRKQRRVLVELPTEADSGANRMWVGFDALRTKTIEETEAVA